MRLIDADVLPEISLFGTTEYINVKKAQTIPAVTLDQIKEAREEIADRIDNYPDRNTSEYEDCLAILDKLIAEVEG